MEYNIDFFFFAGMKDAFVQLTKTNHLDKSLELPTNKQQTWLLGSPLPN